MITKELQQLSDKLTGGHTSAHEISKQVDYIEKNYEGGGSGAGVLIVECTDYPEEYTYRLDKTWQEIYDAMFSGVPVMIRDNGAKEGEQKVGIVVSCDHIGNVYSVLTIHANQDAKYYCDNGNPNEYPHLYYGD